MAEERWSDPTAPPVYRNVVVGFAALPVDDIPLVTSPVPLPPPPPPLELIDYDDRAAAYQQRFEHDPQRTPAYRPPPHSRPPQTAQTYRGVNPTADPRTKPGRGARVWGAWLLVVALAGSIALFSIAATGQSRLDRIDSVGVSTPGVVTDVDDLDIVTIRYVVDAVTLSATGIPDNSYETGDEVTLRVDPSDPSEVTIVGDDLAPAASFLTMVALLLIAPLSFIVGLLLLVVGAARGRARSAQPYVLRR